VIILFSLGKNLWSRENTDTTYKMSLEQAIEYALEHNVRVRNSHLDIESAKKEVWQTTAIGLPQISGNVDYQYIPGDVPTASFGAGEQQAMLYDYLFNSLGDLGYPPPSELTESTESEPIKLGVKSSATYSVTVSQLIFSGEYIVGLQASRAYKQLSEDNNEQAVLELKQNVSDTYYSILVLQKNITNLKQSIKNLEQLVFESKKMVEVGFIEETDMEQIELARNSTQNTLSTIERQREAIEKLFKIQLGMDLSNTVMLSQSLDQVVEETNLQEIGLGEFDVKENVTYKMAENQEKISELNLKREKSKLLPSLSSFYTYQDKTNKPEFDFTINHIVGLNLQVPIFSSWQRMSQIQQAQIELEKSSNQKALTRDNLMVQVQQARYDFLNALEKYKREKKNTELARRIYEKSRSRYKEGMASSRDLTDDNNQYIQAQSDLNSAILELLKARTALRKAYNKL
jgi:outer membrane protein TolC